MIRSLGLLSLLVFLSPESIGDETPCVIQVANYTTIDPRETFAISAENALTHEIAYAYAFTRFYRETYLGEECKEETEVVRKRLEAYFPKRLLKDLRESGLNTFLKEWKNLLLPFPLQKKEEVVEDFPEVVTLYLDTIKESLFQKLELNSRWASWIQTEFNLMNWSLEWSALMGDDTPEGVQFKTKSIGLRPALYTPDELIVFLFHALAHLNDPAFHLREDGSASIEERFQNEVFAWKETLYFLDTLINSGWVEPKKIQAIHARLKDMRVEQWVRSLEKIQEEDHQ